MKKSGKKMNKKGDILTTLLALLAIALLVGLAAAQEATRSLPTEVDPGAEFDVSINVPDLGSFGKVNETLPPGFTYVSSSLSSEQITIVGNVLSFILFPAADFTYRVKASETPGTYTFTGKVWDSDRVEHPLLCTEVTVLSPTPAPSPTPTPSPSPSSSPTPSPSPSPTPSPTPTSSPSPTPTPSPTPSPFPSPSPSPSPTPLPTPTPATTPTPVYDYVSEASIEGEGIFSVDKKVRNRAAIVNVDKHIRCNGSIDGFVINEYLIEDARGNTPNFEQVAAVDNYRATAPGHYLYGDEKLRSSFVFGGAGARIHETYDVQNMDARLESINLHSTGDQRYKTELDTINDFSGYFLIDARQSIPGVKHIEDRQEFFGNFTVRKHISFRENPNRTNSNP